MSLIALLPAVKADAIVYNIATLFARLINGIVSIIIQYNCNNNSSNKKILKVLLHNLYVLLTSSHVFLSINKCCN